MPPVAPATQRLRCAIDRHLEGRWPGRCTSGDIRVISGRVALRAFDRRRGTRSATGRISRANFADDQRTPVTSSASLSLPVRAESARAGSSLSVPQNGTSGTRQTRPTTASQPSLCAPRCGDRIAPSGSYARLSTRVRGPPVDTTLSPRRGVCSFAPSRAPRACTA